MADSARRRARPRPAAPRPAQAQPALSTARPPTTERGLRDLVGGGRSQLSLSAALRARDLNRPTAAELAEAEAEVEVIRRHWKPS